MNRRVVHAGVVAAAGLPVLWLAQGALRGTLGANPVETITHVTGDFALRFLLASLAVTPLRRASPRLAALAPYRRTFGLLAFTYALLHAATFFALDLEGRLGRLAEEVAKRPYVTLGFAALALLAPLAATSTRAAQRRLGPRWLTLHRLSYGAAAAAVAHFVWLVKADVREPLLYAAVLAALLAVRAAHTLRRRRVAAAR